MFLSNMFKSVLEWNIDVLNTLNIMQKMKLNTKTICFDLWPLLWYGAVHLSAPGGSNKISTCKARIIILVYSVCSEWPEKEAIMFLFSRPKTNLQGKFYMH